MRENMENTLPMEANMQVKTVGVKNKEVAQALANLLWNEKERHQDDIRNINKDLHNLAQIWGITPSKERLFISTRSNND